MKLVVGAGHRSGRTASTLLAAYRTSGDPALLKEAAVNLGQRYVPASAGDALICQLVGLAGKQVWAAMISHEIGFVTKHKYFVGLPAARLFNR